MIKFIEVVDYRTREKLFVNISHIVRIEKYGYGEELTNIVFNKGFISFESFSTKTNKDNTKITVYGNPEDIMKLINESLK